MTALPNKSLLMQSNPSLASAREICVCQMDSRRARNDSPLRISYSDSVLDHRCLLLISSSSLTAIPTLRRQCCSRHCAPRRQVYLTRPLLETNLLVSRYCCETGQRPPLWPLWWLDTWLPHKEVHVYCLLAANTLTRTVAQIFWRRCAEFPSYSFTSDILQVVCGNMDSDIVAKYVVLAASYCLLRYMETTLGHTFAPHSVRCAAHLIPLWLSAIVWTHLENRLMTSRELTSRMVIDRRTANNLELVCNSRR